MFNFFKRNKKRENEKEDLSDFVTQLLDGFEDSLNLSSRDGNVKLKENSSWQEIQLQDKQIREEVSLLGLYRLIDKTDRNFRYDIVRRKLFKAEFNPKTPPSQDSLIKLFKICENNKDSYFYCLAPIDILFCFRYYKGKFGKDSQYKKARNSLTKAYKNSYNDGTLKKIVLGLEKLDYDANDDVIYDRRDFLGRQLDENWSKYDDVFKEVIAHCWLSGQRSKPTVKWSKTSLSIIHKISPKDIHVNYIEEILELLIHTGKSEVKRLNSLTNTNLYGLKDNYYLHQTNEIALSYFIWYSGMLDNHVINKLIGQLALTSYNKIRGIGPLSTKNGNACMLAFTIMSPKDGITQLLNIRNKTRNKSIKNTANKQLVRKAKELGISKESLLELSVNEFNLVGNLSKMVIGGYTGVIDLTVMKSPVVFWINNTTKKKQKSTPKEISQNYTDDLKIFKSIVKELKITNNVHSKRLENSYLDNIEWSIEDWKSNYIDHPFLSRYTSKLIWMFDNTHVGIKYDGNVVGFDFELLDINSFKTVKLWHPIYSDVATVGSWRDFILNNKIIQSFKQAYREIYLVTDAELVTNTYSNRFAAHVLYQHQFSALAKVRDWSYSLQGAFDSHNTPSRLIPGFQLRAEFWVEPISDDVSPIGIYSYVASDQVRVYNTMEVLEMKDIPKIVFSEIMRDVDLFVGVTSIGNNPEWVDVGDRRNYWYDYSFGKLSETAKTRKAVLEKILPKLKIYDRCSLEEKFLIVKGRIRDYKIHLGSGNILMTPNDQYLCIVPSSKSKNTKIFLPFENDRTLSIIISKALLLYNDDKISDSSISRQIKL